MCYPSSSNIVSRIYLETLAVKKPRFIAVVAFVALIVLGGVTVFWDRIDRLIPGPRYVPAIHLRTPPGFTLTKNSRLDCVIYYLTETDADKSEASGMGIFVGWFPNSFRPSSGVTEEGGILCGKRTTWFSWAEKCKTGTVHAREAYYDARRKHGAVTVHVNIYSPDIETLKELQKVAADISFLTGVESRTHHPQPSTLPAHLPQFGRLH